MSDDKPALKDFDWNSIGFPQPAKQQAPTKAAVREALRELLLPRLAEIVNAQVAQACGIKYLVKRDEDGKFARIGAEGIGDGTHIEVWEKDPSTAAAVDLLNRCIDKPKEQEQEIIVHDADRIRERLDAWKVAHRTKDAE